MVTRAPDPVETGQRHRILRTAAQLFAAQGYHAVGVAALCDAVQLGRGALYHHISSKEDLLYDIAREYIDDLANAGARILADEADAAERVRRLGGYLVRKIASHQAELTVCFREVHSLTEPRHAEVMALHARYERVWREALVDGAESGRFRPYDPLVLKGVLGMYFYSYLWMKPHGALGPETIAARFDDMALRMLAPEPPA